ncbi:MAG: RDD family protein, partial [Candidatus Levybacteria bacterium]|nr:RDD family protein [Candidatus Levybacteria bacterium]
QALLRYGGFLLSGFVFFLGFAWILLNKKRQGWHDRLANTMVVTI